MWVTFVPSLKKNLDSTSFSRELPYQWRTIAIYASISKITSMDFVLRENIERSNSSQRRSARKFQNVKQYISSAPCFCIHNQWCKYRFAKENIFLYNTFSVSTDSRTLSNRHLEEGWKRISWNTLHTLYWFDTCFQGCSERCSQK